MNARKFYKLPGDVLNQHSFVMFVIGLQDGERNNIL